MNFARDFIFCPLSRLLFLFFTRIPMTQDLHTNLCKIYVNTSHESTSQVRCSGVSDSDWYESMYYYANLHVTDEKNNKLAISTGFPSSVCVEAGNELNRLEKNETLEIYFFSTCLPLFFQITLADLLRLK